MIKKFDTDEWSWFELRYHLKENWCGIRFYCISKCVVSSIDCDSATWKKDVGFLECEPESRAIYWTNSAWTQYEELVPEYRKIDTPSEAPNQEENSKGNMEHHRLEETLLLENTLKGDIGLYVETATMTTHWWCK